MTRILRRLFVSPSDISSVEEDQPGDELSPRTDSGRVSTSEGTERGGGNTVAGISGARSGYGLPPPAAKVAFPALIARYCKGGKRWEGQRPSWLKSDESTCTALEVDVHALAMLVFVEWREFVSALPGCGAVLSRETSALWFAQVMRVFLLNCVGCCEVSRREFSWAFCTVGGGVLLAFLWKMQRPGSPLIVMRPHGHGV